MFKKFNIIIIALLGMAMMANAKKPSVEVSTMNHLTDSMNYALGLVTGYQVKIYKLPNDSSPIALNEFVYALQCGYEGQVEELSDIASMGKNIGLAVQSMEKTGLANNPAWSINQKIFFQGLVNGIYSDSTVLGMQEASEYFQAMYQASALSEDSIEADKPVLGSCPSKAKQIALKTTNDSLNYAFGLLNGYEIGQFVLADDSTRKDTKEFIKYVNLGVKSPYLYPELVQIGEELGKKLLEQKSTGLLGEPTLLVNFELIQRGFIDGFKASEDIWEIEAAQEYLQVTLTDLRYGESKRENEQFLVENALREGVITTPSGLQYEVIEMGNGIKPLAYDQVHVHYHGTLIDGTVFDSSVDRGEPITFGLNQVIPGWTEGLQLMPVGSKFRFYIPQELAYGDQQAGSITPFSTLIFDVELLNIKFENTPEDNVRYLSANVLREGVKTTPSGLQYEVITMGDGKTPKATDKVKVHYHGTLIDGTVFDSSVERGESIIFGLNEVIAGWTEGLQLMPVGSKFRFYIPQELAYGDQEVGSIPALSTLIFEVELLSIEVDNTPENNAKFLAENAIVEGVTTTTSGLQYKVITWGDGAIPAATDTVTIKCHGMLIDDTVIDHTEEPVTFALDQVIAGLAEGIQLMPVGSKFNLYIPAELAYGSMRVGAIVPHATIIYEVELLNTRPNLHPVVIEEESTVEAELPEVTIQEVVEVVTAEETDATVEQ